MTPREHAAYRAGIQAVIDLLRASAERLPLRQQTLLIVAEEAAALMSGEQDKQVAA